MSNTTTDASLQTFMQRHCRHMALCTRLDEELGTLHGLSWADYSLLAALDAAGGALSTAELADTLGLARSRFLLQVLPLEKIGLIERVADAAGSRRIVLRPAGRRQMREATSTAAELCKASSENS